MKSLTLALCVIAILGAAASTVFYIQIGKTKEQLEQQVTVAKASSSNFESKLTEANTQADALQKRLVAMDTDLGEAKSKSTAAESRNTLLSRDVAQLRNQLTAKDDAEQALNTEITQLKRDLAQAKLAATAGSPEEIDGYKASIATLQARVTELEGGRSITASPSSGIAGGTAAANVPTPSGLQGEVVSIGAHNAFVVLNVGSTQGVKAGQHFAITHNSIPVATAQVSSVQENFAIAQIAANSLQDGLSKGDTATITAQ